MTEKEWLASTDPAVMLANIEGRGSDWSKINSPRITARKLRLFAVACCRRVWHLLTDDAPCGRCSGTGWYERPFLSDQGDIRCSDCNGTGRINRSRRAVEVAERFADDKATHGELHQARFAAHEVCPELGSVQFFPVHACDLDIQSVGVHVWSRHIDPAVLANLLREIVGNPFRPVTLHPSDCCQRCGFRQCHCKQWPADQLPRRPSWLSPTVLIIAQSIYERRAFDEMPALADALEDTHCDNAEVLGHCRKEELAPGQWLKCRGCGKVYRYTNKYSDCGHARCDGEESDDVEKWRPLRGPHVRGCWVLDLLLGKS